MPQHPFTILPSEDLRRRMNAPVSPEEQRVLDEAARREQADDPIWKKTARTGLESLVEALRGTLGLDPLEGSNLYDTGIPGKVNIGAQLLQAGLPFKLLFGGKPVYHGTGKVFEKFNPRLYHEDDTLGRYTHFAEHPDYADAGATGAIKSGRGDNQNIIAAQPEAQNILDLVNPNWDDLSQAVASLDPTTRRDVIDNFRRERRLGYDPKVTLRQQLEYELNRPQHIERMPFDAIRYKDVGNPSLAVRTDTPITAHYGRVPLMDTPQPIQIVRLPDDAQLASQLDATTPRLNNLKAMMDKVAPNKAPAIHIDKPETEIPWEQQKSSLIKNEPKSFRQILGPAGGSHGALKVQKSGGPVELFKPSSYIPALGEVYGSTIANTIAPSVPVAKMYTGSLGQGTIQPFKGLAPIDWNKLSPLDEADLFNSQVGDWLAGNHDAHPGQFGRGLISGSIVPFDKGQSFKYWQEERLDPYYHPNQAYGEQPPVYSKLLGKFTPEQAANRAEWLRDLYDDKVNELTYFYAMGRKGFDKNFPTEHFLNYQNQKLKRLPDAFREYYSYNVDPWK